MTASRISSTARCLKFSGSPASPYHRSNASTPASIMAGKISISPAGLSRAAGHSTSGATFVKVIIANFFAPLGQRFM